MVKMNVCRDNVTIRLIIGVHYLLEQELEATTSDKKHWKQDANLLPAFRP